MGACSQIVSLIIKGAVRSTAFLLHIAEDSQGTTSEAKSIPPESRLKQKIKEFLEELLYAMFMRCD
jgi:hypothetical protein